MDSFIGVSNFIQLAKGLDFIDVNIVGIFRRNVMTLFIFEFTGIFYHMGPFAGAE